MIKNIMPIRYALIALVLCSQICLVQAETNIPANAKAAIDEVRQTIDEVVKVAVSQKGASNKVSRRASLREIISSRFDFPEMSKRSLGAAWLKMSKAQQDEFVEVFSSLLARTYLERVETVEEKMVTIDSEKVSFPKALVKTSVHRDSDVFPLDYRLHYKDGAWKVYDVIIENIGLVSNYRNEFSGIIRKDGIDGLIKRLKEKEDKSNS
jgi:phospholipid transport system substrate-binding protein